MENTPGTYALILENTTLKKIQVGKLGRFSFSPGWYIYTGSAFGPGGLAARVGRHFKQEKKCRWHIDYLSTRVAVTRVWYTTNPVKFECQWAKHFFDLGGSVPAKGFGASDCRCCTHLFFFSACPSLSDFQNLTGFPEAIQNCDPVALIYPGNECMPRDTQGIMTNLPDQSLKNPP